MLKQEMEKKNMTLEEAHQQVYQMIIQGKNFRDVAKTEFTINGHVKRFSISQISKIKEKFEPVTTTFVTDLQKAEAFRLFRLGKSPSQVLVITKFPFDYIKQAYGEFLEFEGKIPMRRSMITELMKLAKKIDDSCINYSDMQNIFYRSVMSHIKLASFTYPCTKCRKPIQLGKEEWPDVKGFLQERGWCHDSC